jgi:YHS domain-containing protein
MKLLRLLLPVAVVGAFTTLSAADKKPADPKAAKAKPYPLKICVVTDDELKKDAFTYVFQGREIKLCCDECKKDFEKEPAKYVKILEEAEKKQAANKAKQPKKK